MLNISTHWVLFVFTRQHLYTVIIYNLKRWKKVQNHVLISMSRSYFASRLDVDSGVFSQRFFVWASVIGCKQSLVVWRLVFTYPRSVCCIDTTSDCTHTRAHSVKTREIKTDVKLLYGQYGRGCCGSAVDPSATNMIGSDSYHTASMMTACWGICHFLFRMCVCGLVCVRRLWVISRKCV